MGKDTDFTYEKGVFLIELGRAIVGSSLLTGEKLENYHSKLEQKYGPQILGKFIYPKKKADKFIESLANISFSVQKKPFANAIRLKGQIVTAIEALDTVRGNELFRKWFQVTDMPVQTAPTEVILNELLSSLKSKIKIPNGEIDACLENLYRYKNILESKWSNGGNHLKLPQLKIKSIIYLYDLFFEMNENLKSQKTKLMRINAGEDVSEACLLVDLKIRSSHVRKIVSSRRKRR